MDVNRFRKITKVGSVSLLITGLFLLAVLGYLSYEVFVLKSDTWFNYAPGALSTHYSRNIPDVAQLENVLRTTASIITPIKILVSVFALWKGSRLFNRLSKGDKPFTHKFSKLIKRIGLLLMVTDVILPILYSLIVSAHLNGSLYVNLGVGSTFLIGLLLLVVAAIFDYGIELQFLSDETV